jgi:hypothetical protein
MSLPTDSKARKNIPMARGCLYYFPDALAEVAIVSQEATKQHHPDKPMHWDRSKSSDHADCIVRHQAEAGKRDTDGMRHSAKVAWRALAQLQIEIEEERKKAETEKLEADRTKPRQIRCRVCGATRLNWTVDCFE